MLPLPVLPESPELQLAELTIPDFEGHDERKRRYLAYRLCGFSSRESAQRTNTSTHMIKRWKADDPNFARIEATDLLTLRKLFARDFLTLQFTRNMKLASDRDAAVLDKVNTAPEEMTAEENAYLLKIRPLYSPEGLRAMEELAESAHTKDDFSFDEMLIIARRSSRQAFPQPAPDTASRIVEAVGVLMSGGNSNNTNEEKL